MTDHVSNSVASYRGSLEYRIWIKEQARELFRDSRGHLTTEPIGEFLQRRKREARVPPSRPSIGSPDATFADPPTWISDWRLLGFEFDEARFNGFEFPLQRAIPSLGIPASEGFKAGKSKRFHLTMPYWSFVLPLTLISSWLLLSQPKKWATTEIAATFPVDIEIISPTASVTDDERESASWPVCP